MIQRITFTAFIDAFKAHARSEQFSYEGFKALFEHIEELEQDTGEQLELDVIALCCDYSELDADELTSDTNVICELKNGSLLVREG